MNMSHTQDNLLLIDANPADRELIQEALSDTRVGPYQIECVENLSDSLERLSKGGIVAILADLFLPDSQGIETLDRLLLAAPRVPILFLSGLDDEGIASQAVQRGAQD
jgi:CheY-like chemotaxis protein